MNLQFDQPELLLLGLLGVPLAVLGWRWLWAMDRLRRTTVLLLRSALLLALAVMLAGPRITREHNHLTVIGVLDNSSGAAPASMMLVASPRLDSFTIRRVSSNARSNVVSSPSVFSIIDVEASIRP